MKIILKLIVIVTLFCARAEMAQAQNLIPNPGFEQYDSLYWTDSIYCDTVPFWIPVSAINWNIVNMSTYWYFHEKLNLCDSTGLHFAAVPQNSRGYEYAHSGKAYIMAQTWENGDPDTIASGAAMYQCSLLDSLIAGHKYCFSAYISSFDCGLYYSDAFGAYFSKTAISTTDGWNFIQYTPQVSNPDYRFPSKHGWTLVSGSFIAGGGELYVTIGSFENDTTIHISTPDTSNTWFCPWVWDNGTAVFIDDVSLYDCTGFYYEAEAGENRNLCKGEETMLGWDENTVRTFKWSVVSGDSASLDNDSIPRPTVSPQQTTVYALYVTDEYVQEHFDTVTVEVIDCENPIYLPNIFSPNGDGQNDVYYARSSYVKELKSMRIYDRWGEEVFSCRTSTPLSVTSPECGWDGTFHGQEAPIGVYAVVVEAVLLNGETVVKKGNVTLVR